MAKLHFLSGPLEGTIVDLLAGEITIGRDPQNVICINDPSVSEFQARVNGSGESYVIQDLGSDAGTFVEGQKIASKQLEDGDRIVFGLIEVHFESSVQEEAANREEETRRRLNRLNRIYASTQSPDRPRSKWLLWLVLIVLVAVGVMVYFNGSSRFQFFRKLHTAPSAQAETPPSTGKPTQLQHQ